MLEATGTSGSIVKVQGMRHDFLLLGQVRSSLRAGEAKGADREGSSESARFMVLWC